MGSSLVGGFLFDLPEAESWVGTASRPDVFRHGAARRGAPERRPQAGPEKGKRCLVGNVTDRRTSDACAMLLKSHITALGQSGFYFPFAAQLNAS
jgi:hypothetical protein